MPTAREENAAPLHIAWFGFQKAKLCAVERDRLEQLVPQIDPQRTLVIVGFTDDIGPQDYNDRLAEQRASACARVLIAHGIDPQGIRTLGRGRDCYLGDNETKTGRAQNRRVELRYQQSSPRVRMPNAGQQPSEESLHRVALTGGWPVMA